jgi:hypothetical protein
MTSLKRLLWLTVTLALAMSMPLPSNAKVKPVSTDGEATVYLNGDFSKEFDLSYDIAFHPARHNRSLSFIDVLLLGGIPPSGSITVGLMLGAPNASTLSAFVTTNPRGGKQKFEQFPVTCLSHCHLELKGNATHFFASIQGRRIRTWSRSNLFIRKPYVQLNGEVNGSGDSIFASVTPIRVNAGGRSLRPTCAFTTQGIEARGTSANTIEFVGSSRSDARVTYVSLRTGKTGDKCPPEKKSW